MYICIEISFAQWCVKRVGVLERCASASPRKQLSCWFLRTWLRSGPSGSVGDTSTDCSEWGSQGLGLFLHWLSDYSRVEQCGFVSCWISAYPPLWTMWSHHWVQTSLQWRYYSYRWPDHPSDHIDVLYCLWLSCSFFISIDAYYIAISYIDHVALRVVCVWPMPVSQYSSPTIWVENCKPEHRLHWRHCWIFAPTNPHQSPQRSHNPFCDFASINDVVHLGWLWWSS